MSLKTYKPEQIIGMQREAEIKLSQGQAVGEICRGFGVSEHSYYRWRREYGGMEVSHAKGLHAHPTCDIPHDGFPRAHWRSPFPKCERRPKRWRGARNCPAPNQVAVPYQTRSLTYRSPAKPSPASATMPARYAYLPCGRDRRRRRRPVWPRHVRGRPAWLPTIVPRSGPDRLAPDST